MSGVHEILSAETVTFVHESLRPRFMHCILAILLSLLSMKELTGTLYGVPSKSVLRKASSVRTTAFGIPENIIIVRISYLNFILPFAPFFT